MSKRQEVQRQRRRVLALYAATIGPPIVILAILAILASRDDSARIELFELNQARATAREVSQRLEGELEGHERRVLADLRALEWRSAPQVIRARLNQLKEQEPLLGETVVVAGGEIAWPPEDEDSPWRRRVVGGLWERLQAQGGGGELRHVYEPPRVIACAAEDDGVLGFSLDLEAVADLVLAPELEQLELDDGVSLELLDRGTPRLRVERGEAGPAGPEAEAPFGPVPLWSVRVIRPESALRRAGRGRLWRDGVLVLLALIAAALGGRAVVRYVERSVELSAMKADFLSNITHELKTPLTSIKMYGEMLALGRVRTEEKRQEYAQHVVRESTRLQKMIEDVLDFARQESSQGGEAYVLAEEDVADTVREALGLFRASATVRGFDLFLELPRVGALPPVDLDREAIVRAVLNLLSNAVKYSGDSRYLRVAVARQGEEWITISVEDKGIGIDPADLEHVFDRFYRAGDVHTRAISGTGLGLALVEQIVKAHQGQIRVESEPGRGSRFTIQLPIVSDFRQQWPPPEEDEEDEEDDPGDDEPGSGSHPGSRSESREDAQEEA